MDDVIVRPRHTRYRSSRKRRRNFRHDSSMREIIIRQVAISVIILVVVGILKSIDTPATGFLTDKVKLALSQNIDLNGIYNGFDSVFRSLANDDKQAQQAEVSRKDIDKSTNQNSDSSLDQSKDDAAVPASGSAFKPGDASSLEPDGVTQSGEVTDFGQQENAGETQGEQDNTKPAPAAVPDSAPADKGIFIIPVKGVLGSSYGNRIDPIKNVEKFHYGIDIEANKGTPIKAAASGQVIVAATDTLYGKYIKIDHGTGFITLYAHCSELIVKKGQKVKQGDVIAKVGETGAAVGPHLHFEIWKNGKSVNPLQYVQVPIK